MGSQERDSSNSYIRNTITIYVPFCPVLIGGVKLLDNIVLYFLSFIYGACIQSFINVVVYRVPRKISFTFERSKCEHCDATLSFIDLMPILSWCVLGGKCRRCGKHISIIHPITELISGLVWLLCMILLDLTLYFFITVTLISIIQVIVRIYFGGIRHEKT